MNRFRKIVSFFALGLVAGCGSTSPENSEPEDVEVSAKQQALTSGPEWVRATTNRRSKYDPGTANGWFFNDHAIYKDPAIGGKWHMIGITDDNPLLVEESDQFGHATTTSLNSDWVEATGDFTTPEGWALKVQNDAGCQGLARGGCYRESHLWAPHIFYDGTTYYMYYSGGNATYDLFGSRIQDKDEINLARAPSLDGPWERLRTGPLFLDGYQARDPMVFQLAPNSYIMYYTATENPSQSSKHVVAYRLSNDLINWSQTRDGIAFSDLGDDGTDAGGTESPFVAERDIGGTKYYYLFLGPQPYEGYLPPNYPGTNVYVSKDPKNFLPKNQVGHLGLHAVELVQDGANYLVSDAGWGKDYVSLYDFEFLNTPVKGSTLYALTAAKDKILKFSAGTWNPIGGQSTQLVAGGGLGVFSLEGGSLYLYDAAGRNVVSTTGSGYATNSNSLYRKDSNGVSKWNGAGDSWTNIGTAATTLYPGGKELFASNPWDGNIYHYSGSGTTWTKVGGGGDSWTANANGLFGTQFFGLYQYSGTPNYWIKVGNSTNNLISSGDKVYATDSGGSLKIYSNVSSSNKNAQWTKVANSATAFAACDDMLYALRGTTVYKQSDPNAFAGTPLPMGVYSVGSIVCGK